MLYTMSIVPTTRKRNSLSGNPLPAVVNFLPLVPGCAGAGRFVSQSCPNSKDPADMCDCSEHKREKHTRNC